VKRVIKWLDQEVSLDLVRSGPKWVLDQDRHVSVKWTGEKAIVEEGGLRKDGEAAWDGSRWWIWLEGRTYRIVPKRVLPGMEEEAALEPGVLAPMTGTITEVCVHEGSHVMKGDLLLKMEAMKMEYSMTAPENGTVRKVSCKNGNVVEADQILLELEYGESK